MSDASFNYFSKNWLVYDNNINSLLIFPVVWYDVWFIVWFTKMINETRENEVYNLTVNKILISNARVSYKCLCVPFKRGKCPKPKCLRAYQAE